MFVCVWFLALWLATPGATARVWDVREAGAMPDASTDCTVIFQGLLDEAGKAGGGILSVPAGRYRFEGTLTVPANVTLQGVHRVAPTPDTTTLTNWGPIDRCIVLRSEQAQLTASATHFVHWDNGGAGSPAIQLEAGRAIVQGCTFNQDKLHVQVGSNVTSAILTANQAPGGFRVENRAGRRTQMALNETDSLDWTPSMLGHYQVRFGTPGDGPYLEGWHGPEKSERPFRWSAPGARLQLPVTPGETYTLTFEYELPVAARASEAGLYGGGQRLAIFDNQGVATLTLPASSTDRMSVEVRVRSWVPRQVVAGSQDDRTLGLVGYRVTMRRAGGDGRIFDIHTGQWTDEP